MRLNRDQLFGVFAVCITAAIALYWAGFRHNAHTSHQLQIASRQVEQERAQLQTAIKRYRTDYENESFIRKYIWFDAENVKEDKKYITFLDKEYVGAQLDVCRLKHLKSCPVAHFDSEGRSAIVLHRIGVISIVSVVLIIITVLAIAFSFIEPLIPFILAMAFLIGLATWYLIH